MTVTVYWKGGNKGVEGSFAEGLSSKTLDAEAAVDNGDGTIRIPSTAHGFLAGDYVVIAGSTNYNGNWLVKNIPGADDFDIETSYVAETFGGSETAKSSNWQDKDGVPIAVPVATDTIILDDLAGKSDGRNSRHEEGKHWNLVDDIAIGDTGELEITAFYDKSSFTGKLGIDSENTISPFHISIAAGGEFVFESNSQAYVECSANDAVTSINIPLLIHNSQSGYLQISSDVNDGTWKSEWDEVRCLNSGTLELADNTVCQVIRTYNSTVNLIIGTGCVDTSDTDDPIDLYIGSDNIYSSRIPKNEITCDGIINFGTAKLQLTKS